MLERSIQDKKERLSANMLPRDAVHRWAHTLANYTRPHNTGFVYRGAIRRHGSLKGDPNYVGELTSYNTRTPSRKPRGVCTYVCMYVWAGARSLGYDLAQLFNTDTIYFVN